MKDLKVSRISKRITVRFSDEIVQLPIDVQRKIDAYWDNLVSSNKDLRRGEVFTVTHKGVTTTGINILVERSDYAHYLYCQNVEVHGENNVRIIHIAALVETVDGFLILGEMGKHTSRFGVHQLCGGGLDDSDLRDGIFDLDYNTKKELFEELGIDASDKSRVSSFEQTYFKEGGPTDKMTVIYTVKLHETKKEFLSQYEEFVKTLIARGENPEFDHLITLKKSPSEIVKFIGKDNMNLDEYMRPLFAYIVDELGSASTTKCV